MSPPNRGAFIVIEGLDRSGKSTQAARLLARIQAESSPCQPGDSESPCSAVLIKFPDRTTAVGKTIDGYLRSEAELDDHAIHLLFSANRWELAPAIHAHLSAGTTPELSYEWCRAPDIGLPAPDLTLFLSVEPEVAMLRGGYGEERYEKREVQRKVGVVFDRIGKEMSEAGSGKWVVIDAGQDREKVAEDIWGAVGPVVKTVHTPVRRLWENLARK
ncbi:thymidylate kinase [Melanogaster broomeanus]|nr:thymidylate kinase [Melanogaster broomeanus]